MVGGGPPGTAAVDVGGLIHSGKSSATRAGVRGAVVEGGDVAISMPLGLRAASHGGKSADSALKSGESLGDAADGAKLVGAVEGLEG